MMIKDILKRLHRGEDLESLKKELSNGLAKITPWEIGFIEQMLIADGIKPLEISFLCNTHVELFKDRIVEDKELLKIPSGHPLNTLFRESHELLGDIEKLPSEVRNLLSKEEKDNYKLIREGDLELHEGYLSREEIDAILQTLPIDISFVDKHNRLRYYSLGRERIFVRTRTTLGRPVAYCHPPRSVHIVKKIIEEFKAGRRDKAGFWINLGGLLIYITYYPVETIAENTLVH